jgi:hypothetical protein
MSTAFSPGLDGRIGDLEARSGRFAVAIGLAIACQACSLFLYSPPFGDLQPRLWGSYGPLCADPFTRSPIWEAQTRHRILAPLIAYGLGLRGTSGAAVPVLANTAFLALLYILLRRSLPAGRAAMSVLLMATTLVVITSQTWLGYPDSLGHLGLLICLSTRPIWPLIPCLLLMMLAEERSLVAAPLIVLWHFLREPPDERWSRAVLRSISVIAALALWLMAYQWMKEAFLIRFTAQDAHIGLGVIQANIFAIPGGYYYALRSAWLLPIMLATVWWRRRPIQLGAFLAATAVALIAVLIVDDLSRAMAFSFPAVLIALVELERQEGQALGYWLRAALFLNLFTPQYQVLGFRGFYVYWPMPFALVKALIKWRTGL